MKQMTVGSLDINMSFSRGLHDCDHEACFVTSKIHSREMSQVVFALNILRNLLEFF